MLRFVLAALAALSLTGEAMAVEFIRVHMACTDGVLTAMRNRTNTPVFAKRGGWEGNFSVDLRRTDNQSGWNGASWVMCRDRCWIDANGNLFDAPGEGLEETVSYEAFVADVIQNAKHNTGAPNVAVVTYLQGSDPGDDFDLSTHPRDAFNAMLAAIDGKKGFALERVPAPPPEI